MKNQQVIIPDSVAEIGLIYRSKVKASERSKISSSADAYKVFKASWDGNRLEFVEQFEVLLLNKAKRAIGIFELATGGTTSLTVEVKLVFAAAIKANANEIIVCHNHPSGNLKESNADRNITQKLVASGKY